VVKKTISFYTADYQEKIVKNTKKPDLLELATIRNKIASIQGKAVIAKWDSINWRSFF
jgi:hypothetical protein